MATQRKYFGTDGIRGIANQPPLDPESLVRLGKAIAKVFLAKPGQRHRILIGKDTRLSGYLIEASLTAGITSMGVDVYFSGPIPTPAVSYLTRSMRADAGVMISASHNPFEDNGIKIFGADGCKLPDEVELQLEQLMEPGRLDAEHADASSLGKAYRMNDAEGRFTVFLKECFPREFSLEGFKIGIDAANGAAYVVGPQTFTELGAEVSSRGISPNGKNINSGFGSLYPEVVRELVLEQNLDLGVAVDGDADRAILVDEKGNVIDGDQVLAVCAVDMKNRGLLPGNAVVGTVMSNLGLDRFLAQSGIKVIRTGVGDRYVLEEMLRSGIGLGGEQSGHVIFSRYSKAGDGILTALMVLAVMCRTKKPLSQLLEGYSRFPQKIVNIRVSHKPPFETIPAVQQSIEAHTNELGSRGRVLVRYSGTENKARVMVECEDEAECKRHAEALSKIIEQEIGAA